MDKPRPKIRKVMFTTKQATKARDSEKFASHRNFIEWLFKTQHNCVVTDFTKLVYDYGTVGQVTVHGVIGHALDEK